MYRKKVSSIVAVVIAVCLLFSPLGSSRTAASTTIEIDPLLSAALDAAAAGTVHTAILTYYSQPSEIEELQLKSLGLKTITFKHLPIIAVQGTKEAIQQTYTIAGLRSVYSNKQLEYFLRESVPYIGADRVWNELGYTGKGVTVAVIDSGIDALHQDLAFGTKTIQNVKFLTGNLIFEGEPVYLENVPNTDTSSGHGTHVAGIIAGTGTASQGTYKGVAPGAQLVGLGVGDTLVILWALEAFDYVLEHKDEYNIQVINNSWGTTGEYSPNDPINVASKAAHDAGVTVVFAAGNEGPGSNTLNPYSVAPWVIGVAAGTKDGKLADFSSRGIDGDPVYHPTLTAPGVDIVSTRASTGSTINALTAADDATYIPPQYIPFYTTASGTSMASPHIAGVVALMLEAKPGLQPDVVKDILVRTADPMAGYKEFEVGAGYVNAYNAVATAEKTNTRIGKYKDPKSGKTYDTYSVTSSWEGIVGPGASEAGVESVDAASFDVGRNAVSATVRIEWTTPGVDLDLYVYDPNKQLAGKSAQGLTVSEETTIPDPVSGTWTAETRGWLSVAEPYTGTSTVEYILK
ncbi:S8 family serine peptidase [Paenibacillus alkalitolerans]|uniref:S8 family serine peptidase n=1 Tax=Paenibacillus alkalitolerans TaxID=2799335 RepID=UPI0018F603EF|nr:S8 family serine peptidase [Paenibacillus alkalitolerans]